MPANSLIKLIYFFFSKITQQVRINSSLSVDKQWSTGLEIFLSLLHANMGQSGYFSQINISITWHDSHRSGWVTLRDSRLINTTDIMVTFLKWGSIIKYGGPNTLFNIVKQPWESEEGEKNSCCRAFMGSLLSHRLAGFLTIPHICCSVNMNRYRASRAASNRFILYYWCYIKLHVHVMFNCYY